MTHHQGVRVIHLSLSLILAAALLGACHFEEEEPSGGGCTPDTPGTEGKLIFDFMMTDEDLSLASGRAFSAGTSAHMNVKLVDESETLEAWTMESGDENVLTVDDILPSGDYPFVLGLNEPGPAELSVLSRNDGDLIDRVTLQVAEPEGLDAFFNHPFLYEVEVGDQVLIPSSDGGCILSFFPCDTVEGQQRRLYGEYEMTVSAPGAVFEILQYPIGAVESRYDQRSYVTAEIHAASEGTENVTFSGPRGLVIAKELRTVQVAEVDDMSLEINSVLGLGSGQYVTEYGFLVAVQRSAGSALCGGFPVSFVTDHAEVIQLGGSFPTMPNAIEFQLLAPGSATVTATLDADPAVRSAMTFVVTEPPEEE
jgi:hypothetical protein